MVKDLRYKNTVSWLKLFTYISATVILLSSTGADKLVYLIPLVIVLFFVNYFREYYLEARCKHIRYIWTSIIIEMLLILSIGYFNSTDANILLFFACISSVIIGYSFAYSIPMALIYIGTQFCFYAIRNGVGFVMGNILSMFFSYSVSTAFVMMMCYLVKIQIRERERLSHVNAELETAYKKLIESSAAARKLTVEQERTRMAREIHDTLAHTLTSLIVQLEACKELAAQDPSRLPGELNKAQELSREGFNDVKRSIKALRPQVMEDKSFVDSIISSINGIMENTKVHVTLNNSLPNDLKLPSSIEVALFRVIQESITNSIRHGRSSEIEISIKLENNTVELDIEDNGTGCANIKKGYGIRGISERIEDLGGDARFSSTNGSGFKTNVYIPYEVV